MSTPDEAPRGDPHEIEVPRLLHVVQKDPSARDSYYSRSCAFLPPAPDSPGHRLIVATVFPLLEVYCPSAGQFVRTIEMPFSATTVAAYDLSDETCRIAVGSREGHLALLDGAHYGILHQDHPEFPPESWPWVTHLITYVTRGDYTPRVAWGRQNGSVGVMDGGSGQRVFSHQAFACEVTALHAYAAADGGARLVVGGGQDGRLVVLDLEGGGVVHTLEPQGSCITAFATLPPPDDHDDHDDHGPDPSLLMVASYGGVQVLRGGRVLHRTSLHAFAIAPLVQGGQVHVASAGREGVISIHDVGGGEGCLRKWHPHDSIINFLRAYTTPEGELRLLSRGNDPTFKGLKLWDPITGACLHEFTQNVDEFVYETCLLEEDGRYLLMYWINSGWCVWDIGAAPPRSLLRAATKRG
jgi:hypothetical protein